MAHPQISKPLLRRLLSPTLDLNNGSFLSVIMGLGLNRSMLNASSPSSNAYIPESSIRALGLG